MNMIMPVIMILINWSIDATDPTNQENVLYIFIGVHALMFVVGAVLFFKIAQSNEKGTVLAPVTPGSSETEELSVSDYDTKKLREMFLTKVFIPLIITYFIFKKWNILLPLLFQSFNNPMMLFKSELVQIHLLGKPAKFELARPWTEPSPMPEWLSNLSKPAAESSAIKSKKKR